MRLTMEEREATEIRRQAFSQSIDDIRAELDDFYNTMASFGIDDSTEIFQNLAGFTARASFIRAKIMRMPENRALTNFRTKELDPFIDECDRQFKLWSRAFSVQSNEWEQTRGI